MKFLWLLVLMGCHRSPESQMVFEGAPEPIICIPRNGQDLCRDGMGDFWFCRSEGTDTERCMRASEVDKYFATGAEVKK